MRHLPDPAQATVSSAPFVGRVRTLCRLLIVASCGFVLTACLDPDPPLLSTQLPNNYEFRSNGGDYGYIHGPTGLMLSEHFGVRNDGTERWCTAFGWRRHMVVCRLREDRKGSTESRNLGFFLLNTRTGDTWIAADEEAARSILGAQAVAGGLPSLATQYPETRSQ